MRSGNYSREYWEIVYQFYRSSYHINPIYTLPDNACLLWLHHMATIGDHANRLRTIYYNGNLADKNYLQARNAMRLYIRLQIAKK